MSPLGALLGLALGAGVLLIATGLGPPPATNQLRRRPTTFSFPPGLDHRHVIAALATFVIVSALTKWWAAAGLASTACVLLPMMVAERAGQVTERNRLAALAGWVESVRDLLAAASGIEEAIVKSAETLTPESPIRETIWQLRAATEALGLREGLRRFGERVADPIGDYIAATLLVASERPSSGIHGQLTEAAQSARESVSVRERIEASRSRMWTASSTIGVISIVMVAFVIGTQPTYAAWYATPVGQTILLGCGLVELVGMWWMARIARPRPGHRVVLFEPPTMPSHTIGTTA
jgi:tight adherence protein B